MHNNTALIFWGVIMNINDKIQSFLSDEKIPGAQKVLLKTFITRTNGQEMTTDFIKTNIEKLQQTLSSTNKNTRTGVELYMLIRILSGLISE